MKPQRVQSFPLAAPFANLSDLGVVLPSSYFQRAGHAFFSSVALIDVDGCVLGNCRKTHSPQGPGYEEKFFFARRNGK